VTTLLEKLELLASIVAGTRDILDERVDGAEPPRWCTERGWGEFLLGLSEQDLATAERAGFDGVLRGSQGAPAELRALAEAVAQATRIDWPPPDMGDRQPPIMRSVPARKRAQLRPLLAACSEFMHDCSRVVDVGAGRGALTRLIATELGKETVGLEREAQRVQEARRLAEGTGAQFLELDVVSTELGLHPTDFVIGLHACGEAGDALVREACRARSCFGLLSCCLQKIHKAERAPLSAHGARLGLVFKKPMLGLSNLVSREQGVESSLEETLAARQARLALRILLRGRGIDVQSGAELRGMHRRHAHRGFASIAERALELRGLPNPSASELEQAAQQAEREFAAVRRLSLPRNMLAAVVELSVVLDRAAAALEHGYEVRVHRLLDDAITPRNLLVVARPCPERKAWA
jgi:SAM-dependent methyltransferase